MTENFATNLAYSIKENNEISSATGEGKIPLVAVEDIAQAAFNALTALATDQTAMVSCVSSSVFRACDQAMSCLH